MIRNFDHELLASKIRNYFGSVESLKWFKGAIKYSQNPEFRKPALTSVISFIVRDVQEALRVDQNRTGDEEFKKSLAANMNYLRIASKQYGNETSPFLDPGTTFNDYVQLYVKSIDRHLSAPNIDQERAKIIAESLKEFRIVE